MSHAIQTVSLRFHLPRGRCHETLPKRRHVEMCGERMHEKEKYYRNIKGERQYCSVSRIYVVAGFGMVELELIP
jgi:hypothetical protein